MPDEDKRLDVLPRKNKAFNIHHQLQKRVPRVCRIQQGHKPHEKVKPVEEWGQCIFLRKGSNTIPGFYLVIQVKYPGGHRRSYDYFKRPCYGYIFSEGKISSDFKQQDDHQYHRDTF